MIHASTRADTYAERGARQFTTRQLTSGQLPPRSARWVASRKANLVRGVEAGLLSLEDACSRYAISADEFLLWQHRLARHGARGLRVSAFKDMEESRHARSRRRG